jgi:hypothetical protein
MHWIVQNNIYSEEGWGKLIDALDRLQVSYSIHKCVPFAGILEPEPAPPPGPVIVMGSYTLAREAQRRGWIPGVFLNENFDYEIQENQWMGYMFNDERWIGAVKDVPEQRLPFFIRPTTDSKSFTGFVTDWLDFCDWRKRLLELRPEDGATMDENTRVLVSPKKFIAREYRTWIVDGKVITASLYKQGPHKYSRPEVDDRVIEFANARAQQFQPARAFVLDVFEDEHGLLYIGEINNLNSAGFYAADMQKLVAAIDNMTF